jgi:very-short-patch-repair endonuclease
MSAEAKCDKHAAKQHGVVSRKQALAAGLTERAIDLRVATGRWRKVHPGIYVVRSVPPSWHQRLVAAILSGGPSALASHRSAGILWRLDGLEGKPVEVSVKSGIRISRAIVHRRRQNDDPTTVVLDRIRSTGIQRTLLDLCAVLSRRRAGLALDDALRRGLTTLDATRETLESGPSGRSGIRTLRGLVDARDQLDGRLESRLESEFIHLLRRHRLLLPSPQYVVVDGDSYVARLDFAYPTRRLGIETDGYRWHGGRERWSEDLRRENRLKLLGWTILRFSWKDIHDCPETVVSAVRAALARLSPLPTSSVGN